MQPFLVLHLDILPEPVQSLEDALKFFAAPESLEGYKAASSKVIIIHFALQYHSEPLCSFVNRFLWHTGVIY